MKTLHASDVIIYTQVHMLIHVHVHIHICDHTDGKINGKIFLSPTDICLHNFTTDCFLFLLWTISKHNANVLIIRLLFKLGT